MKVVTDEQTGQVADYVAAQNAGRAMAIRIFWGAMILAAVKGVSMLF